MATIGVSAFEGTGLEELTLTENIKNANANAFASSSIEKLIFHSHEMTVHETTFEKCDSLKTIEIIGETMEDYETNTQPWLSVRNHIDTLILTGVTTIGKLAFEGMGPLTSIQWGESVKTIGEQAFFSGTMEEVTIPDSVTSIQPMAFKGCSSLERVSYPISAVTSSTDVFDECNSLKTLKFTGTSWSQNYDVDTQPWATVKHLITTVELTDGIARLSYYALQGMTAMTSITIPNTVKTIARYAFAGSGLTSVTLPSTVELIGVGVFDGCTELSSVTW